MSKCWRNFAGAASERQWCKPLRQAQRFGHAEAVLAATRMGLGVYARLGFREVCKLSFWEYGKMRQL
jgi:hypothetical protein